MEYVYIRHITCMIFNAKHFYEIIIICILQMRKWKCL